MRTFGLPQEPSQRRVVVELTQAEVYRLRSGLRHVSWTVKNGDALAELYRNLSREN